MSKIYEVRIKQEDILQFLYKGTFIAPFKVDSGLPQKTKLIDARVDSLGNLILWCISQEDDVEKVEWKTSSLK